MFQDLTHNECVPFETYTDGLAPWLLGRDLLLVVSADRFIIDLITSLIISSGQKKYGKAFQKYVFPRIIGNLWWLLLWSERRPLFLKNHLDADLPPTHTTPQN